ncbi:MAG: BON domain-containing protein, partial [Candidatus Omnitrophica bacterium]|nr:BON domain-containing protein [Candidatus Omnitrophota bacterium]
LSGSAASPAEKSRAIMDAWVAGVGSVDAEKLVVVPDLKYKMRRQERVFAKDEEEILMAVKNALIYDPRVLSPHVEVSVSAGVVTLEGTVESLRAKRAAGADAMNTVGVLDVVNLVKVRPVDAPADEIIAGNVRSAIEWDPYLEKYEINVIVRNNKAYLYGAVDNNFEKRRAEEVASEVFGVVDVSNNLATTYVWPEKSDAQIKEDIQDQFFWSMFVDSGDIDVEVEDGVVTLTGEAGDWAEEDAAVRNALEAGAHKVVSMIEVEGEDVMYPTTYYYYDYYWALD